MIQDDDKQVMAKSAKEMNRWHLEHMCEELYRKSIDLRGRSIVHQRYSDSDMKYQAHVKAKIKLVFDEPVRFRGCNYNTTEKELTMEIAWSELGKSALPKRLAACIVDFIVNNLDKKEPSETPPYFKVPSYLIKPVGIVMPK